MKTKYLLGVDGGNTKTHYFLYDTDGAFIDFTAAGTCSHEALKDSFEGTKRELGAVISGLLKRNGIGTEDIAYAVFGLAGADFDYQKVKLSGIISDLGIKRFTVDNDGFLALKAGSSSGAGVCCINGTGTVTVGINEEGKRVQIGGLGDISGDAAGAGYIAQRGVKAVYDMLYRCGKPTALKEMLFKELGVENEKDFALTASNAVYEKENIYRINKIMEEAEAAGDEVVKEILSVIGEELAKTVSGCIKRLEMRGKTEVVLAGSVWIKSKFVAMYASFEDYLKKATGGNAVIIKLKQPPAAGAVIWAMEEYRKEFCGDEKPFNRESLLNDEALLKLN